MFSIRTFITNFADQYGPIGDFPRATSMNWSAPPLSLSR